MRNVSDKDGEKVIFFFYESLAIYEIFWKNFDRNRKATDGNSIRRMHWLADN